ncbi:MAG: hypothetical protein K6T68_01920 [Alicyclobacillus shizuokensis]|nr:hypothetical protein [Alicyclobacillus shizuokensis]MCL6625328.1 hypothetical protein [Alicyclobacillus shizuokensis]
MPWRYSGRTVVVRQVGTKMEVWSEGEWIATHEKSDRWGGLVRLPKQYEGLAAVQGWVAPKAIAVEVAETDVEQRPLEIYEQLAMEVGALTSHFSTSRYIWKRMISFLNHRHQQIP